MYHLAFTFHLKDLQIEFLLQKSLQACHVGILVIFLKTFKVGDFPALQVEAGPVVVPVVEMLVMVVVEVEVEVDVEVGVP